MPHDVALSQTDGLDLITDLTKIVVVDEFFCRNLDCRRICTTVVTVTKFDVFAFTSDVLVL